MAKLKGKVALVTGSGRGLGRSYALRLAGLGADVVINDVNLESAKQYNEALSAATVMDEIRAMGCRSLGIEADLAKKAEVEALFAQILDAFGQVDILVNKEPVDTLSYLVHRDKARPRALHYCEQLSKEIPRHQFKIPVQGVIGGTVIARSTIQPYRKDVTEKLYGGDVTRKKKLLEKQKKGKAKMKQFGQVNIPQKAFVSVLRADKD